jgi:hypothetical protein
MMAVVAHRPSYFHPLRFLRVNFICFYPPPSLPHAIDTTDVDVCPVILFSGQTSIDVPIGNLKEKNIDQLLCIGPRLQRRKVLFSILHLPRRLLFFFPVTF